MHTINKRQLEDRKNQIKDLTLINTMPANEFDATRIPGSINIPQEHDDFVDRVASTVMNNKEADIIVYCAGQQCDLSSAAAKKLDSAGFQNVYEFEGGFAEWSQG